MVQQVPLKNHPGMWLDPEAAASFERMEAAKGIVQVNQAGRTAAEQAALVARWNKGGAANRPPYLYQPAAVGHSNHETGTAFDTNNPARMKSIGPEFGWTFDIPTDTVHFQYHANKDTHAGGSAAPAGGFNQTVKNEQDWLNSININVGTADGIIGPKYRAGVKAYQSLLRAYGYTGAIDGIWGDGTQAAHQRYYDSKHAAAPVPASTGGALSYSQIQTRLQQLGFYHGKIDGVWGPASHAALGAFQKAHGLVEDYLVGPKTRGALGI